MNERYGGFEDEDYGADRPQRRTAPRPPQTKQERRALNRIVRKSRPKPGALAIVLLVLIVSIGGPAGWLWWQIDPPIPAGDEVSFVVPAGATTEQIASLLESNGVISSAWAFEVYVAASGSSRFQAGQYTMRQDIGVKEAIEKLNKGGVPVVAPTKKLDLGAPGLTLQQIAQRVATLNLDPKKFLDVATSGLVRSKYQPASVNSMEGLILPLVYEVPAEATEGDVAVLLRDTFDQRVTDLGVANTTAASAKAGRTITPYEAIVTASMIQREAGVPADQPQIAAVIYNRIRLKMRLQIDATVLYAKGNFSAELTLSDLSDVNSPYNTYLADAFPPTPIGTFNPEFLQAALAPTDISALYYVRFQEDGAHKFADTLDQHNANIADAQRRGII